jgi:hypothetical protein
VGKYPDGHCDNEYIYHTLNVGLELRRQCLINSAS